ncbi:MAG: hypothetical protein ACK5M1_06480 [Xanthomarina gelatinilytica]|uniref:hypothetical protein n=1 Tax=Xanthomarina gelatinilytica TaxID=1137281 RepID=UPI003A84BE03
MQRINNKTFFIFPLFIIFLFSCEKEPKQSNTLDLVSKSLSPTETFKFLFNRDTVIVSNLENKYYLNREDFKGMEDDTVEVQIWEYFNKEDLLNNNIRTLTDKGDLLESKGVLKICIYQDSSFFELKERKKIKMELKNQNYLNYDIYIGNIDNKMQMCWKKEDAIYVKVGYPFSKDSDLYMIKETTIDSLEYYNKLRDSIYNELKIENFEKIEKEAIAFLTMDNNTWINIDKLVETPIKKDFSIKLKQTNHYDDYMIYVIYENTNSFINYYITGNDLKIKKVPIIGNAKGVIVTYANKKVLYDEFNINENTDLNIPIDLKEIELERFKDILTN